MVVCGVALFSTHDLNYSSFTLIAGLISNA